MDTLADSVKATAGVVTDGGPARRGVGLGTWTLMEGNNHVRHRMTHNVFPLQYVFHRYNVIPTQNTEKVHALCIDPSSQDVYYSSKNLATIYKTDPNNKKGLNLNILEY